MTVVRALYQLQLVDSERDEKREDLAAIVSGLGDSDEVLQAQQAVSETESNLDRLRVQVRDLELEISGVTAKLEKNQERLYSGRVRNPKELSNLQEEAAALRRRRSELEDGQLELMIAIEEEEAELAERQARLRQMETTWRDSQATLLAQKDQLEQRLSQLEEERLVKRAQCTPVNLALYDDLRSRLGGKAVALLKGGSCHACGVDVPTGLARMVERGEGLQYCPTCNRLLYVGG